MVTSEGIVLVEVQVIGCVAEPSPSRGHELDVMRDVTDAEFSGNDAVSALGSTVTMTTEPDDGP